ncbi:MAG TPA: ABC transporter permease [bacterium]|nr:ABC transporter permease [bacterium]
MRRPPPASVLGALAVLALLVVAAVFAGALAPYDPAAVSLGDRLTPPALLGGTWRHPLGTDALGQDVLSRVIYGGRISLLVAVCAVAISGTIGVGLGVLAGFFGGVADDVIMRVAEIQLAFPSILLYISVMAVLGPGLGKIILVIGVVSWVAYARIERGAVLALREREFIEAARAMGAPAASIIRRHVLPNTLGPMIVVASFTLATAIVTEASLSFLGLGVPPSVPSWGRMLSDGRDYLQQGWWMATAPGIAIMLVVLAVNVAGDWLRDRLDPRLRF